MAKKLTVSLLKDKHGAKSHGSDTASANVDAKGLHLLDKSGRVLGVKGNVGSIIKALDFNSDVDSFIG